MDGELIFGREEIRRTLSHFAEREKLCLLIDSKVEELHGSLVEKILPASSVGPRTSLYVNENTKSLNQVERILRESLSQGFHPSSLLVSVGGGTTTDIGTFIAANAFRGMGHLMIPTTLLGQVDAGIGGKGGIDCHGIRNVLSCIHFPLGTFIENEFISTCSARDIKSGQGEMLKHCLLRDLKTFESFDSSQKVTEEMIRDHAEFKRKVVEADPLETLNQRIFLNLGHSFAHCVDDSIPHGVAVAWGCAVAVAISVRRQGFPESVATQIYHQAKQLFEAFDLRPEECYHKVKMRLAFDKKRVGSHHRFVLLKHIGQPIVDTAVTDHEVRDAIFHVSYSQKS